MRFIFGLVLGCILGFLVDAEAMQIKVESVRHHYMGIASDAIDFADYVQKIYKTRYDLLRSQCRNNNV